ncbi:hypothetical protein AaE_009435, partial [Aphanomyces astaci]
MPRKARSRTLGRRRKGVHKCANVPIVEQRLRPVTRTIDTVVKAATTNARSPPTSSVGQRRVAWAVYFMDNLGAPPSSAWHGVHGAVSNIVRHFQLQHGKRRHVLSVIVNVTDCIKRGVSYSGKSKSHGGQNKCIDTDAVENQIIANCMEHGHGLRESTFAVNQHRQKSNSVVVGMSAVYSAYHRLSPVVSSIPPIKQGNSNMGSAWATARLGWTRQLAVRLGIWSWDPSVLGQCPSAYDAANLTPLDVCQIVSWDETHKTVKIGGGGHNTNMQVRFKRDTVGRVCADGALGAPKTYLNTKYSSEASGEHIGVRCVPFVYTGQWICTIKDYEALIQQEIQRVKGLTGECSVWVTGSRQNDS